MSNLDIKLTALADYHLDQLEDEWRDLHQRSEATFFLSWNWIGSWLSILPSLQPCHLVQAFQQGQLVAMGIFYERQTRRHGFVKSTQWHLHRTGDDTLDQIWIEYNDFLIAPSPSTNSNNNLSCDDIREQMWLSILESQQSSQHVDEVVVGVSASSIISRLTKLSVLPPTPFKIISEHEIGYKTSLQNDDINSSFPIKISKSTYNQIRKTSSELEKIGDISFEIITDPELIQHYLFSYSQWHVNKWHNTKTPSGFSNPIFTKFHQVLIDKSSHHSSPCLHLIKVGGSVFGLNYGFLDEMAYYFYLSCLKPMPDNKIKLGLLLHKLAIIDSKQSGLTYYDFLAGESRYKSKLSDHTFKFASFRIQRPRPAFYIENFFKLIKSFRL